ncbi:prenylated Rab acceptor protein 1 isoform X1 [Petaurus breviceps papuanus]|uniref:prenylated Rab acceptor protein 1 isoform X1 n=1 Tax=Petaurus breviceps papuanus TaxID=3040969 RepID=UPI0036D8DDAB
MAAGSDLFNPGTEEEGPGLSVKTLLPKLLPAGLAGREWLEQRRATIRPWGPFLDQRRFSRPRNLGELCQRLVRNVEHYQSNYVFVFLGLILYCVPRGEPSTSVCLGRGHLFPLLLAGWSWLSCLLGLGSHFGGHRVPCSLPPAGGSRRWGGVADGACVKGPHPEQGGQSHGDQACWPPSCAQPCQLCLGAPPRRADGEFGSLAEGKHSLRIKSSHLCRSVALANTPHCVPINSVIFLMNPVMAEWC